MLVLPLHSHLLNAGDDLASIVAPHVKPGDIVVVSSKAAATTEGRFLNLSDLLISDRARSFAKKTDRSPEFCQAVLQELRRLHGKEHGTCPGAILTEVRPEGMPRGTILVANAGLDESNAPEGMAIGWPVDVVKSVGKLRKVLEQRATGNQRHQGHQRQQGNISSSSLVSSVPLVPSVPSLALILSDSSCAPRRRGVTAIALACSGIDPIIDLKGTRDLFGKKLRITSEALADQLATAANTVMGNAGDSVPAAIIRDHGIALSDFEGWVPGIEPEEDLFKNA